MPSVLLSDALTTLANVKEAVGIGSSDTSKDNQLERCINRASQWIEGRTERKLKARNYNGFNATSEGSDFDHKTTGSGDTVASEDYLFFSGGKIAKDDNGYTVLYLPQYPILKVSGTNRNVIQHKNALTFRVDVLNQRGSTVTLNETWTALTEFDDYIIDQQTGALRLLGSRFFIGQSNYRVKCTAGLIGPTADTQPYVPSDLEELCVEVSKQIFRGDKGVQSETLGSWSKTYKPEMKDDFIESVIARYRRISF